MVYCCLAFGRRDQPHDRGPALYAGYKKPNYKELARNHIFMRSVCTMRSYVISPLRTDACVFMRNHDSDVWPNGTDINPVNIHLQYVRALALLCAYLLSPLDRRKLND